MGSSDDAGHVVQCVREDICFDFTNEEWEEFKSRIIFVYKHGDGGMLVAKDAIEDEYWIWGARFNKFLPLSKMRGILAILCAMGVKTLGTDTHLAPKMDLFWELMGFEQIGQHIWSINLTPRKKLLNSSLLLEAQYPSQS